MCTEEIGRDRRANLSGSLLPRWMEMGWWENAPVGRVGWDWVSSVCLGMLRA